MQDSTIQKIKADYIHLHTLYRRAREVLGGIFSEDVLVVQDLIMVILILVIAQSSILSSLKITGLFPSVHDENMVPGLPMKGKSPSIMSWAMSL